jgi:hypothetical protein
LLWELPQWISCLEYVEQPAAEQFAEIAKDFKRILSRLEPRRALGTRDSGGGVSDALIPKLTTAADNELFAFDAQFGELAERWAAWKLRTRKELVAQSTDQLLGQDLRQALPLAELIATDDVARPGIEGWIGGNTQPLPLAKAGDSPSEATTKTPRTANPKRSSDRRETWLAAWECIGSLVADVAPGGSPAEPCRAAAVAAHLQQAFDTKGDVSSAFWRSDRVSRLLPACLPGQYDFPQQGWESPLTQVVVQSRDHLLKLSDTPQLIKFESMKSWDLVWNVSGDQPAIKGSSLAIVKLDPRLSVEAYDPRVKDHVKFLAGKNQEKKLADLIGGDDKIRLLIRPGSFANYEDLVSGANAVVQFKLAVKSAGKELQQEIKKEFQLPGRMALDVRIAGFDFTLRGLGRNVGERPSTRFPNRADFPVPANEGNEGNQIHYVPLSLFARGVTKFDLSLANLSWGARSLRYRWHEFPAPLNGKAPDLPTETNTLRDLVERADWPAHRRWTSVSVEPGRLCFLRRPCPRQARTTSPRRNRRRRSTCQPAWCWKWPRPMPRSPGGNGSGWSFALCVPMST